MLWTAASSDAEVLSIRPCTFGCGGVPTCNSDPHPRGHVGEHQSIISLLVDIHKTSLCNDHIKQNNNSSR
jgi:hypothetical protein